MLLGVLNTIIKSTILGILKMSPAQRRDWWENSIQLQKDSLLCFIDSEGGNYSSVCRRIDQHMQMADKAHLKDLITPRNLFDHLWLNLPASCCRHPAQPCRRYSK